MYKFNLFFILLACMSCGSGRIILFLCRGVVRAAACRFLLLSVAFY